jgi:sigma-B regulation protein RsbU (phosphoserine phosphatase)
MLLSGLFAAGIVFVFDRPVLIVLLVVAFIFGLFVFAQWERSFKQHEKIPAASPAPGQTMAEQAVKEYRDRMQGPLIRDSFLMIVLVALGWFFFVHALNRQLEQRISVESELKVARRIQESLLPASEKRSAGWHLFGVLQPASTVAGDYFDYIDLPQGRLGVLAADASGHGVAAGLVMAMLKSQLLSAASIDGPTILFDRLNASVRRLAPKNMFVTAAYAVLPKAEASAVHLEPSTRSRTLEVITVGHPPILLYHAATGTVAEIRTDLPALGLQENLSVHTTPCALAQDDVLLLYTDGLFEQVNAQQEEWGMENLKAVLRECHHLPPPQLAEHILKSCAAHRGNRSPQDDITLVVVRPES